MTIHYQKNDRMNTNYNTFYDKTPAEREADINALPVTGDILLGIAFLLV
ncbi:hypothetical protein [Oceanobacillus sp. FSL W7-1309]